MPTSLRQSVTALLRESLAGSAASRTVTHPSQRREPARTGAVALAGAALLAAPGLQAAGPPVLFATQTPYTTGTRPSSVVLGDVDGDGDEDLVTANYSDNTVSVLLGNGNGAFGAKQDYSTGSGTRPHSVALGDVNNDGDLDVVTANNDSDTISVLINNGSGIFGSPTSFATGDYPNSVALGDVNNDGKLDAVTANLNGNTVSVLLGDGSGSFFSASNYNTGNGPAAVVLGDVDGDTDLDLVTANYGGNSISVLLGDNTGSFDPAAPRDVATGAQTIAVALGDVNKDDKLDLVTANLGGNSASLLLGNGTGSNTFTLTGIYTTGTSPASVALGDVNGDSYLDLVTANVGGNTASVLLSNGIQAGTGNFLGFASQVPFGAATGPRWVALGDVDGDEKLDLVTANKNSDSASVLLNTTALALSYSLADDTLHITPPPASTVGKVLEYTIHYNTPARIAASRNWGIWAKFWDQGTLNADLEMAATVVGCEDVGVTATCYRPSAIGIQTAGTPVGTGAPFVYRVFAKVTPPGGGSPIWTPASVPLTIQR